MKRDTLRDSTREHDTDPTTAIRGDTTEPGEPPEPADADDILDGFSGRPRTYYAKHQPGSNGRSAAKYDAVASPVKAHTDRGETAPVIVATTVEEPVGRILQEASRAAEARITAPMLRVVTPPPSNARRNETTTPGTRPRRSVPAWLVPALVVSAVVVGAVLYITRGSASGPAAPIAATAAAEASSVQGPTSVSAVVAVDPPSRVPAAPISTAMAVRSAAAPKPAPPPPMHSSTASTSPAPMHPNRSPDLAPSPPVPSTSSSPRGDMKRIFE